MLDIGLCQLVWEIDLLTVNIHAGHRPVSVCVGSRFTYGEHIGWT